MNTGQTRRRVWLIASISISLLLAAAVIALGGRRTLYPQDKCRAGHLFRPYLPHRRRVRHFRAYLDAHPRPPWS